MARASRFICIHGHFYQPPRENPWLEAVEVEDSAYPYHDWNERITDECYAPNGASRILDEKGRIRDISNNYSRMSFNFGPTLLGWLERHETETYAAILEADRDSQRRFGGHGSALAQGYNHVIHPLASRRDKVTQVGWGIRDFEARFGRFPEGMWLPETAVDVESLEVLAEHGIRFTVLAPRQAVRVRPLDGGAWRDVGAERVDTLRPYLVRLPSAREIAVFFYVGSISRAVGFERLLDSGEAFAARLRGAFDETRKGPQLVTVATDGETYGHHHRHGDMALAYVLDQAEKKGFARLTNYGEYLERHPPTHEVEILEASSWSCSHGVERWRSDCGCNIGMGAGWSQSWRAPLRAALDWLRDRVAAPFERMAGELLRDPWAARNDFVSLFGSRTEARVTEFLSRHATRQLDTAERTRALELLELQRHTMLMYTSCGWFFDDPTRIETIQVLRYAGRAAQLADGLFGGGFEAGLLERLAEALGNVQELGNAKLVYETFVVPSRVSLLDVGAHYAVASVFEEPSRHSSVYCHSVERRDLKVWRAGRARLAVGRIAVRSEVTFESAEQTFAVVHLGDHNVSGGVREFGGEHAYGKLVEELGEAFSRADLPETLRRVDRHLSGCTRSLASLFRDDRRRILEKLLAATVAEIEEAQAELFERHGPLMTFLGVHGFPLPRALQTVGELVLSGQLRRAIADPVLDPARIRALLLEVTQKGIPVDTAGLGLELGRAIERIAELLRWQPEDLDVLRRLRGATEVATSGPFPVDLWKVQNAVCILARTVHQGRRSAARAGGDVARAWVEEFGLLAEVLHVRAD